MNFITLLAVVLISCNKIEAFNRLCVALCFCEENVEETVLSFDCSRGFLATVPPVSELPDNLTHLDLSGNNITRLDIQIAHGSLRVLDLSYNNIQTVIGSVFVGLKRLTYLNLHSNNIKNFEENAFYGLDNLKSLNLSNNGLDNLPDGIFHPIVRLQELSLADNPLVNLKLMHFNRLVNLRWLDLSYTNLYSLDENMFDANEELEFLNLSGNEFYDVPTDALRSAKNLKHIRLNENPISSLNSKSFTNFKTIEILELSYMNTLEEVDDETFSEMISLRVLKMRRNRQLRYISPVAFSGLFDNSSKPVLKDLDLQGNQLETLDGSMVPCVHLRNFNLQQNPWVCNCSFVWIKDCEIRKVYTVDLKCASPSELADLHIENLKKKEFQCKQIIADAVTDIDNQALYHERAITRSTYFGLAVLLVALLALGIALVLKWQVRKEWHRNNKKKGSGDIYYVKANVNPRKA